MYVFMHVSVLCIYIYIYAHIGNMFKCTSFPLSDTKHFTQMSYPGTDIQLVIIYIAVGKTGSVWVSGNSNFLLGKDLELLVRCSVFCLCVFDEEVPRYLLYTFVMYNCTYIDSKWFMVVLDSMIY